MRSSLGDWHRGRSCLRHNRRCLKIAGDWDLFNSFEGYTWHKHQKQSEDLKQFYIKTQADKEFSEIQNITFDIDLVYINDKVKPTYSEDQVYPNQKKERQFTKDQYEAYNKDMNKVAADVFR